MSFRRHAMHYSHGRSSIISISVCPHSHSCHLSDRFTVILLTVSLLHNVAFNTGTFYLASYYQVCTNVFSEFVGTSGYSSILDCQSVDLKPSGWNYAPSILLGFISGIDTCCLVFRYYSGTHAQYLWPKMGYLCRIVHRYNRFWRVSCLPIPPTFSLKFTLFSTPVAP